MPEPIGNFAQQVHQLKADYRNGNAEEAKNLGQLVSEAARNKNQAVGTVTETEQVVNGAIPEYTLDITLREGENTQSLVYRAVVQNVNETVEAAIDSSDFQISSDNTGNDSPETTSSNLVLQVASLVDSYVTQTQEANPEISAEDAFTSFLSTIREGIDKGFAETRAVLTSLDALSETAESDIQATEDLISEKLDAYQTGYLAVE